MGDETTQFASRYSAGVSLLERLAGESTYPRLRKELGPGLAAAVRDALEAVEAVFASGTGALRKWPEQRSLAISRIAGLRAALDRSGVDDELRHRVRALLEIVEPEPNAGLPPR